jgi:hypothetical protein
MYDIPQWPFYRWEVKAHKDEITGPNSHEQQAEERKAWIKCLPSVPGIYDYSSNDFFQMQGNVSEGQLMTQLFNINTSIW